MPICGSRECGCAIQSTSLTVSGSGTPDNPWVLDIADFNDIAELEAAVEAINAALATLPSTYVRKIGDSMTGMLMINAEGNGPSLRLRNANQTPYIEWRDDSSRIGYLQGQTGGSTTRRIQLAADPGAALWFAAGGAVRAAFNTGGTYMVGKTASDIASEGAEITATGRFFSTLTGGSTQGLVVNLIGSSAVNGGQFANFRRSNTGVGSISTPTATSTAYNTTSDEEIKENIVEVDDELALYWLRITQPFLFNFKATPGYKASATTVGYVAQRLAAAWPEAIEYGIVSPGFGDPADRTWDENGNETTPEDVWQPWVIDYGKITPYIHAGLQALDRRVQGLVTENEDLRAIVRELVDRVTTLEYLLGLS